MSLMRRVGVGPWEVVTLQKRHMREQSLWPSGMAVLQEEGTNCTLSRSCGSWPCRWECDHSHFRATCRNDPSGLLSLHRKETFFYKKESQDGLWLLREKAENTVYTNLSEHGVLEYRRHFHLSVVIQSPQHFRF